MSLNPERKKEINGKIIEEFYWHGTYPVYVDKKLVNISFTRACELAAKEPVIQADAIFDPVCRKCGDPLTTEELICDACGKRTA